MKLFNLLILLILSTSCITNKEDSFHSNLKKSYENGKVYNVRFLMKKSNYKINLNNIDKYPISHTVFNDLLGIIEEDKLKKTRIDNHTEYLGFIKFENKFHFDVIVFRNTNGFLIYLINKNGSSKIISELKYDEPTTIPHIYNGRLFLFQNLSLSDMIESDTNDKIESYRYEVISIDTTEELFSESTIKSDSILKSYLIHD